MRCKIKKNKYYVYGFAFMQFIGDIKLKDIIFANGVKRKPVLSIWSIL